MKNIKYILPTALILIILYSFQMQPAKFEIKGDAKDKTYGYDIKNPIRVGGGTSAGYHFQFIEHLQGAKGEKLTVKRIGSCGEYDNPDTSLTKFDKGVLTCFSFECSSFSEPVILYFDKYRNGDLFVPYGFTWKD